MEYLNPKEFEATNIIEWHKAGFTGKGIKIGVHELGTININQPYFHGKVKDPLGTAHSYDSTVSHANNVVSMIHQVAPDAEIYMLNAGFSTYYPFCIENGLDLFNKSNTGSNTISEAMELEKKAIDNGTFFINAAGNDGDEGLRGESRKDTWLSVGAARFDSNDNVIKTSYSSYDKYGTKLDVMGFGNVCVNSPHAFQGYKTYVTGTSFASPFVVGMVALWKQWFIAKHNRKPSFDETFQFIINNAKDLEVQGYDQRTAYGLFVLPKIESLEPINPLPVPQDIPQVETNNQKLELFIGQNYAYKNGEKVTLYTSPIIDNNNRTLVGVRDVAELFGFKVEWDAANQRIIISL